MLYRPKFHGPIWALALLLLLSLGLRLFLWSQHGATPQFMPDSQTYIGPAESMIEHGTFTDKWGGFETVRTPGYPLLISASLALGWGLDGVVALQHCMSLGMALLAGFILLRALSTSAALIGICLTGSSFLLILYSDYIIAEILFATLITSCFCLLWTESSKQSPRALNIALAAALSGFAVLVRPAGLFLYLPVIIFILCCFPRRRMLHAGIFLLIFAVAPTFWMIRNHSHIARYTVSSITEINLLQYQGAGTLALLEKGAYAENHERIKQRLQAEAIKRHLEDEASGKQRHLSSIYREMSLEIFKQNPVALIKHIIKNCAITLLGFGTTYIANLTGVSPGTARTIGMVYSVPALIMTLYGLVVCWQRQRNLAVLSFLFVGYFVGIAGVGGVGGSRFRIPVEPILCIIIAFAVTDLFNRMHTTSNTPPKRSLDNRDIT